MDDFLYNLRRDSDKRNRRHSNMQQQYRGPDRRGGKDKRNYHRKQTDHDQLAEIMPEIKTLLETISVNQKRRADIEERKAEALEKVSSQLETLLKVSDGPAISKQADPQITDAPKDTSIKGQSMQTDRDEITRLVIEMRGDGKTYKEIAKYLEDKKIPTFSRKGEWHAQTIHKICKQVA